MRENKKCSTNFFFSRARDGISYSNCDRRRARAMMGLYYIGVYSGICALESRSMSREVEFLMIVSRTAVLVLSLFGCYIDCNGNQVFITKTMRFCAI